MKFSEAMDLLKSGKKVTRDGWKDGLYFVMEDGSVKSYQPIVEHFIFDENIMVSDGWIVEGESESKLFCDIIKDLETGNKAKLNDWKPEFYISYDPESGLVLHRMSQFPFNPSFGDFKANDWIEV